MKRSPSYASGVLHRSNTQCVFIIGSTQEKVAHANVDAPPRQLHQDSALEAAGWVVRDSVTPRAMRRTFQDLARAAEVQDIVTRSISGHSLRGQRMRAEGGAREGPRAGEFREAARTNEGADPSGGPQWGP